MSDTCDFDLVLVGIEHRSANFTSVIVCGENLAEAVKAYLRLMSGIEPESVKVVHKASVRSDIFFLALRTQRDFYHKTQHLRGGDSLNIGAERDWRAFLKLFSDNFGWKVDGFHDRL